MNSWEFYSRIEMFKHTQKDDELAHYGIAGQKWGKRRWQNADGTFNAEGKERYFGTKSKKEKSSDTGVKDYIKYKNDEKQKFGTARNPKMNLKIDPELLKEYSEDEIEDSVQSVVNDIRSRAPEGPDNDPSSYDVNVNKDGSFHIDFHYDDNKSDKAKTEKYLDENYDKDFAQVMKDTYDTTGEYGDIDAEYAKFKENPYDYLRKYSRDPKYNLSPKEEKKAAKEAKRLNDEFDDCIGYKEEDNLIGYLRYDSEYSDLINDMIKNDREKYAKEYKRTAEIFDGFENDRNEMYAKAGITNALLYMDDDTMNTISSMARHYTYDDGDQGNSNSSSLYAKYEKGADYGELSDLFDKLNNNEQKIKDNINFLKKDPVLSKVDEKYLDKIVDYTTYGSLNSRLYNATEDSSGINDDERNAYTESKKIAKKLEPSCGARGSGWYYLNQAINNLNMGDISYKDLTDADWNRINDEVNKLKK